MLIYVIINTSGLAYHRAVGHPSSDWGVGIGEEDKEEEIQFKKI
jgi:hypothetical protein